MKTKFISLLVLIVFGMVILITCKKEDTVLSPIAKAGPDQVITLPTDSILLDGSASSNPNGTISKWLWTKVSGPATFTISNSSAARTTVKNLVAGVYTFELKVTNNGNRTATDEIIVTVNPQSNQPPDLPPVTNAGADTTIQLSSCWSKGSATLDGSRSYDSVTNITGYIWSQISGPSQANLVNRVSSVTKADNLSFGQYVFQLQVFNAKGLSSKDTVKIIVGAETTEYILDLNINGSFTFVNNYEDCYYYYYYPCSYYDYTNINVNFNFPPFGQFNFWTYETADTASTSDAHDTHMGLNAPNGNGPGASGRSSINFKKIIQTGGGAFSGTLKIEHGTAKMCNPNIYTNLDPLAITGSIDTTTHTISLTIKGRTYF